MTSKGIILLIGKKEKIHEVETKMLMLKNILKKSTKDTKRAENIKEAIAIRKKGIARREVTTKTTITIIGRSIENIEKEAPPQSINETSETITIENIQKTPTINPLVVALTARV